MRLSKEEHTAIIAQLSYDLEPVTPLPTWNALAMEVGHLCKDIEYWRQEVGKLHSQIDRLKQEAGNGA